MKLSKKKELKVLNKQNEHLQDTKQPVGCYDNLFVCKEKPSFWESDKGYSIKVVGISTPIYLAGWAVAVATLASPLVVAGVAGSLISGDWNYALTCSFVGLTSSLAANIFLPVASDTIEDITDKLTGKILDAIDHSR